MANVVFLSFMLSAVFLKGGLLPAMAMHWAINASQEIVPAAFAMQGLPSKLMWLCTSGTLLAPAMRGCRALAAPHAGRDGQGATTGKLRLPEVGGP